MRSQSTLFSEFLQCRFSSLFLEGNICAIVVGLTPCLIVSRHVNVPFGEGDGDESDMTTTCACLCHRPRRDVGPFHYSTLIWASFHICNLSPPPLSKADFPRLLSLLPFHLPVVHPPTGKLGERPSFSPQSPPFLFDCSSLANQTMGYSEGVGEMGVHFGLLSFPFCFGCY